MTEGTRPDRVREDQLGSGFGDVIREISSHLSDEEFGEVREKLIKKDQVRRLVP